MKNKTIYLTHGALTASLYVILSLLSNMFGLASGIIQIRISEMLTILPAFTPAAIPGLFTGCILSNIITGCAPWDVVFGSLATLIGAFGTYFLKNHKTCALIPPIAANTAIIPWILSLVYCFEGSVFYFAITVFIGEVISCGILGYLLGKVLKKYDNVIRWE